LEALTGEEAKKGEKVKAHRAQSPMRLLD